MMGEKSTTGKQRMQAALKGEKLDRLPVMLLLGGHYAEAAGYTLEQFLTQADAALETVKLTCEELDSDARYRFRPTWITSRPSRRPVMSMGHFNLSGL